MGRRVGCLDGLSVGSLVGMRVGCWLGCIDGLLVGERLGVFVGVMLGALVGDFVGCCDKRYTCEGSPEGYFKPGDQTYVLLARF